MVNLARELTDARREFGDKVTVVDVDETKYTYEELDDLSNRIANLLSEGYGVGEDDIVTGILPDSFWSVAFMFGAMKTGAAFSLENFTLQPEVLKDNIDRIRAKTVVIDEQIFDHSEEIEAECETVEGTIRFDSADGTGFAEEVWEYSDEFSVVPRREDDLAGINYTSGTTGPPKAVQLTHGTLTASARATKLAYHHLEPSDRDLCFMPMYHTGGISSALFSIWGRSMLIITGGWDVDEIVRLTQKYEPNWFYWIIPTMIRDLMSHESWDDLDLSGVKMHVAGEPPTVEMIEALRDKGARPTVSYGMTETMPMAVTIAPIAQDADLDVPFDSTGRTATELGEVKIVDLEDREEITEPNIEGEIAYRGDNLTPGYYNDPERTAKAFDDEGWFYTDDLGYYDEEGNVYIAGRADDMIMSGGEKLSLVEVDNVLVEHELVDDGGTVGVDHERFGRVPAAFVVPSDPSIREEELKDELDEYMLEELARWKRPRLYTIVDEIPRTHSKKTKIAPELEEHVEDVTLTGSGGVTTLSSIRDE